MSQLKPQTHRKMQNGDASHCISKAVLGLLCVRPATQVVCGLGREDGGSPQFSPAPIRRQSPGRRTCRPRQLHPIIMDDEDVDYGYQEGCHEEGVGPPEGQGRLTDAGKGPRSVSSPRKNVNEIVNGSNGLHDDLSDGLSPIKPIGLVPNGSNSRLSASSMEDERLYDGGAHPATQSMDMESDWDEVVDSTRLTASSCPLSSSSSSRGHQEASCHALNLDCDSNNLNNDHSNLTDLTDPSQNDSTLTSSTVEDVSQNYNSSDLTSSELTELWPWGDSGPSPVISSALLHPRQNGVSHSSESLLESEDEEGKFDDWPTCHLRKVLKEIVDTEQCYLLDLEQVINGYLLPLKTMPHVITSDLKEQVFSNIEQIYTVNRVFLERLERDQDDPIKVAQCFLDSGTAFECYTHYCMNYHKANEVLSDLGREHPLCEYIKKRQGELGHQLPLESYLLKPVQRILKYHLFLEKILGELTPAQDGHVIVEEALASINQTAQNINENTRRYENSLRFQEIQSLFPDLDEESLGKLGELILEDRFEVYGAKATREMFLFKYALLIAKQKVDNTLSVKACIECRNLMLIEVVPGEPLSFQILPFDNPRNQYTVKARNIEKKRKWCHEIKRLILDSFQGAIPEKAKELVFTLGRSRDSEEHQDTPSSSRRQHTAPEYLEKRRGRRKSLTVLSEFALRKAQKSKKSSKKTDSTSPRVSPTARRRSEGGWNLAHAISPQKLRNNSRGREEDVEPNYDNVKLRPRPSSASPVRRNNKVASERSKKRVHSRNKKQESISERTSQRYSSGSSDLDADLYRSCRGNGTLEEESIKVIYGDNSFTLSQEFGESATEQLDSQLVNFPGVVLQQCQDGVPTDQGQMLSNESSDSLNEFMMHNSYMSALEHPCFHRQHSSQSTRSGRPAWDAGLVSRRARNMSDPTGSYLYDCKNLCVPAVNDTSSQTTSHSSMTSGEDSSSTQHSPLTSSQSYLTAQQEAAAVAAIMDQDLWQPQMPLGDKSKVSVVRRSSSFTAADAHDARSEYRPTHNRRTSDTYTMLFSDRNALKMSNKIETLQPDLLAERILARLATPHRHVGSEEMSEKLRLLRERGNAVARYCTPPRSYMDPARMYREGATGIPVSASYDLPRPYSRPCCSPTRQTSWSALSSPTHCHGSPQAVVEPDQVDSDSWRDLEYLLHVSHISSTSSTPTSTPTHKSLMSKSASAAMSIRIPSVSSVESGPTSPTSTHSGESIVESFKHAVSSLRSRFGRASQSLDSSPARQPRTRSEGALEDLRIDHTISREKVKSTIKSANKKDTKKHHFVYKLARAYSERIKEKSKILERKMLPRDSVAMAKQLTSMLKDHKPGSSVIGARIAASKPVVLGTYTLPRHRPARPRKSRSPTPQGHDDSDWQTDSADFDIDPPVTLTSTASNASDLSIQTVVTREIPCTIKEGAHDSGVLDVGLKDLQLEDNSSKAVDNDNVAFMKTGQSMSSVTENSIYYYENRLVEDLEGDLSEDVFRDSAVYSDDGAITSDSDLPNVQKMSIRDTVRLIENRYKAKCIPKTEVKRIEKAQGIKEIVRILESTAICPEEIDKKSNLPMEKVPLKSIRDRTRELVECATLTRIRQETLCVEGAGTSEEPKEEEEEEPMSPECAGSPTKSGWVKELVDRFQKEIS